MSDLVQPSRPLSAETKAVALAERVSDHLGDLSAHGRDDDQAIAAIVKGIQDDQERSFDSGVDMDTLVYARTHAYDVILRHLWKRELPADATATLFAVGGYGRGEMLPGSDLDLLVLWENPDNALKGNVETYFRGLWDVGLNPGHAVRTLEDCDHLVRDDVTVATNLMESRYLAGDPDMEESLNALLDPQRVWSGAAFFKAKFAEQRKRHARFGGTAYRLEPNIKEGPGGLRDIQMLAWVARRHYGVGSLEGLVESGFLTFEEALTLRASRSFLWQVRFALHRLDASAKDRLLFAHQRALAQVFGFRNHDGDNLAVEQFMQAVFRTLMKVERLNERLLQLFEEDILDTGAAELKIIDDVFQVNGEFLELRDPNGFRDQPGAILKMFVHLAADDRVKGVRASTIRAVRESLGLINESYRTAAENNACFMELLRQDRHVARELTRMHRYGVLGAWIPEFAAVTGRMQFDLFHEYTVDQHALMVVTKMREMRLGLAKQVPMVDQAFARIDQPHLLYIACLFHDIAKGRGGDHSELGAEDIRLFAQRVMLAEADTELLVWLVRQHLRMSLTAQRRDISDIEVVRAFCTYVPSVRHLDYLYLLTIADIRGTSEKLWNAYKGQLLRMLYVSARGLLSKPEEDHDADAFLKARLDQARQTLVETGHPAPEIEALWRCWPEAYFVSIDVDTLVWHTHCTLDKHPADGVFGRVNKSLKVGELYVHVPDKKGLFAHICLCLDAHQLTIMDARILTSQTGYTLDSIRFLNADFSVPDHKAVTQLTGALGTALEGEIGSPPKRRLNQKLSAFADLFSIKFERRESSTVLELVTSDRPGLLVQIALAFQDCDVQVQSAKIATFGNRVEDRFRLHSADGEALNRRTQGLLRAALVKRLDIQAPVQ